MSANTPQPDLDALARELPQRLEQLRAAPGDGPLNKRVGDLLYVLEQYDDATPHYRRAVAADGESALFWHALGGAYLRAGHAQLARIALERAVALGEADATVFRRLAGALAELNQIEDACSVATKALSLATESEERGFLHALLGYCHARLGSEDAALEQFLAATVERPGDASAQYNVGRLHVKQGACVAAIPYLERAVALQPDMSQAWQLLASAAFGAGQPARAVAALEEVVRVGKEDVVVRYQLAKLHLELGDTKAAIRHLRRAMKLATDADARAKVGALLMKLGRGNG